MLNLALPVISGMPGKTEFEIKFTCCVAGRIPDGGTELTPGPVDEVLRVVLLGRLALVVHSGVRLVSVMVPVAVRCKGHNAN